VNEQLYKRCRVCNKFYPGVLHDWHDSCPAHAKFKLAESRIKQTRSLSPEHYDIYWKDDKGHFHRGCRGCGKPFLKKDGTPASNNYSVRWCSKECERKTPWHLWSLVVEKFLDSDHVEGRQVPTGRHEESFTEIKCHVCGKWVPIGKIDIHHTTPVYTLADNELDLIWNFSNLQALCKNCHKGNVHAAVYEEKHKKALLDAEERRKKAIDDIKKHYKVLF